MKFAIAALLATTSAIKINAAVSKSCVTKEKANEVYDELDTDHSGKLSYDEVHVGLEGLASQFDYTPTAEDWDWVQMTAAKVDNKNPGVVSRGEFRQFTRLVFKHFGLCAKIEAMDSHMALAQGDGDSGSDGEGPSTGDSGSGDSGSASDGPSTGDSGSAPVEPATATNSTMPATA